MPASSTTRRSCIWPHLPRTFGRSRSALTRLPVSLRRSFCVSASWRTWVESSAYAWVRATSSSCNLPSTFVSDSLSGATRCSTACLRCSRSEVVCFCSCSSCDFASSRNERLDCESASEASAFIVTSSWPRASSIDTRRAAYCERSTRYVATTPRTSPMKSPMTTGPTNAREGVGRSGRDHENARSDEPVSPSDLARAIYCRPAGSVKPKKAAICERLRVQRRLDRLREPRLVVGVRKGHDRALRPCLADVDRRRAGHLVRLALLVHLVALRRDVRRAHVAPHLADLQPGHAPGDLVEEAVGEPAGVLGALVRIENEREVVGLVLLGRGEHRLAPLLGVRTDELQHPRVDTYLARPDVLLDHVRHHDRLELAADRALEVDVLGHRHGRLRRAERHPALRDSLQI